MINPAVIVRIGRAIMSALQPLTGERASGKVLMKAKPGETLDIPQYTYFTPRIDGDNHPSWFFKTAKGPNADGSWTITEAGTPVDVYSNLGGVRHNIKAGTYFMPELEIEGLDLSTANGPVAQADFAGGADPAGYGKLKEIAFYETFDGPAMSLDLSRSQLREFPSMLVAFDDLTPADGISIAQINNLAAAAGASTRMFKVSYTLSIIVSRSESEHFRRHEGLLIAGDVLAELTERNASPDGEAISMPSGLQIRQLVRERGPQAIYQKFYIYTLMVSAMIAIEKTDRRVFKPWLRTVMDVQRSPDAPAAAVAQEGPFTLVDGMIIDMTPATLDLSLDGTFTRATEATLFRDARLHAYVAGGRRVLDPTQGIYLEPAVSNALAGASSDFSLWTAANGATVSVSAHADPTGLANAQAVAFPAGVAEPSISLAGQVALTGEPIVFSIFARAPTSTGKTRIRLGLYDGLAEIISGEYELDSNWRRIRWKVVPQSNNVALRVRRQGNASSHSVLLWGAAFDVTRRWGPEYTSGTKAKDQLVFGPRPVGAEDSSKDTPLAVLGGKWTLVWSNDLVPCTLVGLGVSSPKLASVGNGTLPDLFTLELYGAPSSGGATLAVRTRGAGLTLTLTAVKWKIGAVLSFTVDAKGILTVKGTDTHDGVHTFARYDLDAIPATDYLVIGDNSAGTSDPTPGFFAVVDVGP